MSGNNVTHSLNGPANHLKNDTTKDTTERIRFRDVTTVGDLSPRELSSLQQICKEDTTMAEMISVMVINDPYTDPLDRQILLTLRSVYGQCYDKIELIIPDQYALLASLDRLPSGIDLKTYPIDPNSASKSFLTALAVSTAEIIVPLRLGDRLSVDALFRLKVAESENKSAPFLYSDIVSEDQNHRLHSPLWHGNWDWILMIQTDATKGMLGLRRSNLGPLTSKGQPPIIQSISAVQTYGDLCWSIALILSADTSLSEPKHFAHLCYIESALSINSALETTQSRFLTSPSEDQVATQNPMLELLSGYISRLGLNLSVDECAEPRQFKVVSENSSKPLISVVIPNHNGSGLLANALDSLANTGYPNLQIIIVDDASTDYEIRKLYDLLLSKKSQYKAEVIESNEPSFNYSRLINQGRKLVEGEYMVTMNNDVELISRDSLDLLVGLARLPKTGVVGARLLYADLTIQHVGVGLGINRYSGHYLSGKGRDESGYDNITHSIHRASAATGALQVFRTEVFDAVGGYDDDRFPVAFNDVDFCLRVGELGLQVLIDTRPLVFHYEGKTRGNEHRDHYRFNNWVGEETAFAQRWGGKLASDPFYPRIRETLLSWQASTT
ncbi:MAG: glycosyltransferase [Acidimicrobiaceae bacterium]|nr:glycosyltransferase [Acidimicrobiaceae bacterium]